MQRTTLVLLAVLSLTNFNAYAARQVRLDAATGVEDRVIIQRRRIVLVRSPELARQFPDRKRAVVTYPVISGLSDTVVLRRVRSLLAFKNIFDYSLKDYRDDAWLSEFSYVVNYNANYLLDITFMQSGMAAYPDDQTKHFLINLKDGSIAKASDAFEPSKFTTLAAAVNRKLQNEIKQIEDENAASTDGKAKEWSKEANENLKFEINNLDDFSVGRRGIIFLYDAGFPHAIKAFEPRGKYFFSYAELKPYIKRDGLLGQFVD
jgi:hypothetical protein